MLCGLNKRGYGPFRKFVLRFLFMIPSSSSLNSRMNLVQHHYVRKFAECNLRNYFARKEIKDNLHPNCFSFRGKW